MDDDDAGRGILPLRVRDVRAKGVGGALDPHPLAVGGDCIEWLVRTEVPGAGGAENCGKRCDDRVRCYAMPGGKEVASHESRVTRKGLQTYLPPCPPRPPPSPKRDSG